MDWERGEGEGWSVEGEVRERGEEKRCGGR
jgi:hypothetical protein